MPKRRTPLQFHCWVQVHLTAADLVQIMHAHTLHIGVAGVLTLMRLKMSKPKD